VKQRTAAVIAALILFGSLAAVLVVREGGCDRTPDDEPEPACDPTDKTCKAAEGPAPTGS
jgi:hypothetical protein